MAEPTPETVLVRDSKNIPGPVLRFATGDFRAFIEAVKAGQLDG